MRDGYWIEYFYVWTELCLLSRLKTKDGLYLKSFDKNSIKVHSKVKEFYKDLFKKKEIEQREIENRYSKR